MSTTMEMNSSNRTTPLNEAYPSCDRTCAELRIYPAQGDVAEVSAAMCLSPTESGNAGEVRSTLSGKSRTVKKTHWVLSSEQFVTSKDLRTHLDWLLHRVSQNTAGLASLSQDGTKISIVCVWWSATGQGGPTLWPEQLRGLAELGIEVGFDIQFHDSV